MALPVDGPGWQGAISDSSGTPVVGVDAHVNLPGVLRVAYGWLRGILPDISAAVAGAGPVPTGPASAAPPLQMMLNTGT